MPKISELQIASELNGENLLLTVQGNETLKTKLSDLKSYVSSGSGDKSPFKYAGNTNSVVPSELSDLQYKITANRNFVSHPYWGYTLKLLGQDTTCTVSADYSFMKGGVVIDVYPAELKEGSPNVLANVVDAVYDSTTKKTTFTLDQTLGVLDGTVGKKFTGFLKLSGSWNTIMGATNCVLYDKSSNNTLIGTNNFSEAKKGNSMLLGINNRIVNEYYGVVVGTDNSLNCYSHGAIFGHSLSTHKNEVGFPTVIGKRNTIVAGASFVVGNSWDVASTLLFGTYGKRNATALYIAGVGGYDGTNVAVLDTRYGTDTPKVKGVKSLQQVLYEKPNSINIKVAGTVSSQSILPNRFYTFEAERTSLTVTLGKHDTPFTSNRDYYLPQDYLLDRYEFQFEVGATPCNLILPSDVKKENGFDLSTVTNAIVQVCITNKCARFSVFNK